MAPVLLVTGGSRGIGAATARMAAARGYDVAVNFIHDANAADAVAAAVRAAGRSALAIQGDMSQEDDIEHVFSKVGKMLGPVTHLVHSAGITGRNSRLEAVSSDTLREVVDVNVLGALLCLRAAAVRMSTRQGGKGGAIVVLSSRAATIGGAEEYLWYAATKGAVDSMVAGLSRELARDGVRVNAVAPGAIETDIHEPGRLARVVPTIPMGRAGKPEEVAEAILFLLSDAASYITGAILRVSGGR